MDSCCIGFYNSYKVAFDPVVFIVKANLYPAVIVI